MRIQYKGRRTAATFRLPNDLLWALRTYSSNNHVSSNDLVTEAIKYWLQHRPKRDILDLRKPPA